LFNLAIRHIPVRTPNGAYGILSSVRPRDIPACESSAPTQCTFVKKNRNCHKVKQAQKSLCYSVRPYKAKLPEPKFLLYILKMEKQTFKRHIWTNLALSVREPHLCLCKQVGSRPAAEYPEIQPVCYTVGCCPEIQPVCYTVHHSQ